MKLNTKLVASIADSADTTVRTVERRMLGLTVRGARLQARIDRELAAHGLAPGQIYPAPPNAGAR